jgi:carbamoyl-phosphate synthase large subunit
MIEANPRASRPVPFISKATGIQMAKIATKIMLGKKLKDFGLTGYKQLDHYAVKEVVFPFLKLPGVDSILTPEMKSTGEVMGIDEDFYAACYKAQVAAGCNYPVESGGVYITVNDNDKERILPSAQALDELGFTIYATKGTAKYLIENGVPAATLYKVSENMAPNAMSAMREGRIQMIINTPTQKSGAIRDGAAMRRLAVELQIPIVTTVQGAEMTVGAIKVARHGNTRVRSLTEFHRLVN